MTTGSNVPAHLGRRWSSRGGYITSPSTGAVTTIAAATATAGQLLVFRNPSTTLQALIKSIKARFILTTAYGAAQETGCDLILARSFSVNATDGTAVDVGSTVANSGNLAADQPTSIITAGCVRVATDAAITAGTHTLDASPIGSLSGWMGAIGEQIPDEDAQDADGFGILYDASDSEHGSPIVLAADEGFVIRNKILMGATGVGRWDFKIEWEEGALS
jgi:hypothetical protein